MQPRHPQKSVGKNRSYKMQAEARTVIQLLRVVWDYNSAAALTHLELMKQFNADVAVIIAQRHGRRLGIQVPLHAHNLRVTLCNIGDVCERDIACNFLLQADLRARQAVAAGNGWIDPELT